jgi:hypothetical protein
MRARPSALRLGDFMTAACIVAPVSLGRASRLPFGILAAMLMLGVSLLAALELPSKPFLEKNDFYLRSAGFRIKFASDADGQKALRALPSHRFVLHKVNGAERYLYADPKNCVCIFIGSKDNFLNYRDILRQPLPQADDVAPDYKTQAGALLSDDPIAADSVDWQPDSMAEYFRDYY